MNDSSRNKNRDQEKGAEGRSSSETRDEMNETSDEYGQDRKQEDKDNA